MHLKAAVIPLLMIIIDTAPAQADREVRFVNAVGATCKLKGIVNAQFKAPDLGPLTILSKGNDATVRHGHLPERKIMTGIGPVTVRQPRVRDRGAGKASDDPRSVSRQRSCRPEMALAAGAGGARYMAGLGNIIGRTGRAAQLNEYCVGLWMPLEYKVVEPIAAVTASAQCAAKHQSLLHTVSCEAVLVTVSETLLRPLEIRSASKIDGPVLPQLPMLPKLGTADVGGVGVSRSRGPMPTVASRAMS